MSMICPNSCPASTGVVLGNDPPHPGFYAVSAKFAKLQYLLRFPSVLRPGYVEGWQELRAELEARREVRRKQRRFRHDPAAYLAKLEQQCLQLTLPS